MDPHHVPQIILRVFSPDSVYVILQVSKGVGLKVGEVNNVIVVLKCIGKGQSVQTESLSFLVLIHIASNVLFVVFIVRLAMVKVLVLLLTLGA